MNKLLVSNNGIYLDDKKLNDNIIKLKDGEYILNYLDSGEYKITFIISGNVKLIESSFDLDLVNNNNYVIQEGSLCVTKFYNNFSVSEKINIELMKDNTLVDYHFANICRGVEDYIFDIFHNGKKTNSNIVNKSVALKNSHVKFIINSNVKKDAIKSVLNQNTRIVTMGEADASICPNMFIDLDDVNASHGSVIGTFKDDDVFYLMSKGISYNDTLKLLIKGYLLANLMVNIDLRMEILKIIDTYWR